MVKEIKSMSEFHRRGKRDLSLALLATGLMKEKYELEKKLLSNRKKLIKIKGQLGHNCNYDCFGLYLKKITQGEKK